MKFLQIRISNIEEIKTVVIDNLEQSRHKISAVIHSFDCKSCNDIESAKKLLIKSVENLDEAWKNLALI